MYEKVAETYVLDANMQRFFAESNPWTLHAITEILLEAAQRGLWSKPSAEVLQGLKEVYLESEGLLEVRGE